MAAAGRVEQVWWWKQSDSDQHEHGEVEGLFLCKQKTQCYPWPQGQFAIIVTRDRVGLIMEFASQSDVINRTKIWVNNP